MVQLELLETLPERVANHAKLFDGMLQLIPAKYYISQKKPQNENSKYMVNKRKKAPKQEIKEATKKAKKAKLDPENVKSITQVQNEELEKTKQEQVVEDEDMSDGEEEAVGGDFSGLDSAKNDTAPVNTAKTDTTDNFQPMLRSDIAELHTRLQKRIAEMRRKRNAPNSDSPKARSREDMLQERRKRREEKKKALKAKKEKGNKAPSEALVDTKPQESSTKDNEKSSADSIKMDGDLFFGTINVGQEKKKKKGPTDAKTALKKLEEKQAELEKLREEDEEMADAMVEESHWGKAVLMASGEKVKDDPKLLKKTIKRTEAQKRRSAKEWKLRMEKVKQDEIRRQKKREENIQRRKEEKKGGSKNKKKARPGFEGAHRGVKSKKK